MEHTSTPATTAIPGAHREVTRPVEFTGNAREYFGIWIVNVLLTILTLGIYSAWAKVRSKQYFYGNTRLDDHSFRYTADPVQILKGRLVAVALFATYSVSGLISPTVAAITIVLITLLMPAFIVMSMSFQLRNTAYRNIRFNFRKDFRRAYLSLIGPLLVIAAFVAVSMLSAPESGSEGQPLDTGNAMFAMIAGILLLAILLMIPLWDYILTRFKVLHADFGTARFGFTASRGNYYKIYFSAFFLAFLAAFLMRAVVSFFEIGATLQSSGSGEESAADMQMVGLLSLVVLFYLWFFAYLTTRRTNLVYSNLSVDGHQIRSELKVGYMLYLYATNTLAIAVTVGLMAPWARVRTARYRASRTRVLSAGDLDGFIATRTEQQSALGEEIGEVFDMDLGL